jgi:hypothetical protein
MSSTCFEPEGHLQEDSCIFSYGIVVMYPVWQVPPTSGHVMFVYIT